jgi:hypothetical protein
MATSEFSDKIWNRALDPAGASLREGDKALGAMLRFHNEAMSAGVLHAIGYFSPEERAAAQHGYRLYGFDAVAELISTPIDDDADPDDLEDLDDELDDAYAAAIPLDDTIVQAFEAHLASHPQMYEKLT